MYIPQPKDWNYAAEAEEQLRARDIKYYEAERAMEELLSILGSERAIKLFFDHHFFKRGLKVVRRPGRWQGGKLL